MNAFIYHLGEFTLTLMMIPALYVALRLGVWIWLHLPRAITDLFSPYFNARWRKK